MKRIVPLRAYTACGSGDGALTIEDVPLPGWLRASRFAMCAASINYPDIIMLACTFGEPEALVPCSDGAGEVMEVPPDVTLVPVGDRVALIFNPDCIGGEVTPSAGAMDRGREAGAPDPTACRYRWLLAQDGNGGSAVERTSRA